MAIYDAIVVGLGAMGSATLYHLARSGAAVLGIDRFAPPHDQGSSHGDTRVTRLAIGEGEYLTPLVRRSHELWRQIEAESGADLLTQNGELIISSAASTASVHVENFFDNTLAAARDHGIAHERLDAHAIRRRFPQFAIRDEEFGYFEPGGGFVRPEAAIAAQMQLAERSGAQIHTGEVFAEWRMEGGHVRVMTDKDSYLARRVVLAAGAWMPEILGAEFRPLFRVLRQALYWFAIRENADRFAPEHCPIFVWELQGPEQVIYGFPAVDGSAGGIKIATEQYVYDTTPQTISRNVSAKETRAMFETYVEPYLPDLSPDCIRAVTCLYTRTPDAGFIIDRHPASDVVMIVSACSGHGFKHSAAIGEAAAQWALDGASRTDLSPFRLDRFVR